jgi:hypothetical protein
MPTPLAALVDAPSHDALGPDRASSRRGDCGSGFGTSRTLAGDDDIPAALE